MSISRFTTQFGRLKALWILRAFSRLNAQQEFFSGSKLSGGARFSDLELAEFLGLGDLNGAERLNEKSCERMDGSLAALEKDHRPRRPDRMVRRNLETLSAAFELDDDSSEVLLFLLSCAADSEIRDMWNETQRFRKKIGIPLFVSKVTGIAIHRVKSALAPKAVLVSTGLVDLKEGSTDSELASALFDGLINRGDMLKHFSVAVSPAAELNLKNYPHLEKKLEVLLPYLKSSIASGKRGVNILFYGDPGTGKTQLSRVIGQALDTLVCEQDPVDANGDGRSPVARLKALQAADCIMSSNKAVLVFDEAEDVINASLFTRSVVSEHKAWFHQILENNRLPVFWISNSVSCLDPAAARRYDMILEIPVPPRVQRRDLIQKVAGAHLNASTVDRLSREGALSPAVVKQAAKVIGAVENHLSPQCCEAAFINLVSDTMKVQGHGDVFKPRVDYIPSGIYDLSNLNVESDLAGIAKNLVIRPSARICLYGPPGTGKTAFGHWLADKLERPLLVKIASDLLGPYVGESEQNIASVFAEAERDEAILLIDEVDSFLRDRSSATRSWEVTQVNQMLTCIESFPGIFLASTNLMDQLDQAALRRFDLKLYFDYMRGDQVGVLLNSHCSMHKLGSPGKSVIARAGRVTGCTPGDFAAVSRRHRFSPLASPMEFLQEVENEVRLKSPPSRQIGFEQTA